jgi:hypothetical protein
VRPDRHAAGIAARYAFLVGVLLLAAVPLYVYVESSWRPLIVRLASALVLGIALLELRSALAQRLEGHDSALDTARLRPTSAPDVHQRFVALRGDVRAALRSRRHFEHGLWPQLVALATRPLVRPPLRRGRGPSLSALREVIAALERQR